MDTENNDPLLGKNLGPYKIESILAQGGMGRIYRAFDPEISRHCVIKTILPHLSSDQKAVDRFLREIKIGAKANHPNIITFYEAGKYDDLCYLAMEYFPGHDLWELYLNEPGDALQICDIIIKVAAGLASAHDCGIIHRDIKPHNIIVNDKMFPKILDFGLAKAAQDSDGNTITAPGTIVGSPAFMSPEQLLNPDEIGLASDLYGLGAVLYFCLTGHPPRTGSNALEIARKINEPIILPSDIRQDMPPRLEQAVMKCLSYRIEDRYPSVKDFRDELLDILKELRKSDTKEEADPSALLQTVIDSPNDTTDLTNTVTGDLAATLPAHSGPEAVAMLRIFGPKRGCIDTKIYKRRTTIGRSEDCHIILDNSMISRHHATLTPVGNGFVIQDADSRSGLSVNGDKVKFLPLRHGDTIQIGHYVMEFMILMGGEDEADNASDTALLKSRFSLLPAGMSFRYRIIEATPSSIFQSGDTLSIGNGGVLIPCREEIDPSSSLEIELVWPDEQKRRFIGEGLGKITLKHRIMQALKLHRLRKEFHQEITSQSRCSTWRLLQRV